MDIFGWGLPLRLGKGRTDGCLHSGSSSEEDDLGFGPGVAAGLTGGAPLGLRCVGTFGRAFLGDRPAGDDVGGFGSAFLVTSLGNAVAAPCC